MTQTQTQMQTQTIAELRAALDRGEQTSAGLVERIPHPQDGRSHLLRTTSAAQEVVTASKAAGRSKSLRKSVNCSGDLSALANCFAAAAAWLTSGSHTATILPNRLALLASPRPWLPQPCSRQRYESVHDTAK